MTHRVCSPGNLPRRWRLTVWVLLLVGLGPGGLASRPVLAQPKLEFPVTARRVLFLGDSITHASLYVAWIDMQLRLQGADPLPEVISLGLSSETCCGLSEPGHPFPRPNVHERLDRALRLIRPDVVVACYGMNDGIYHPFSPKRFAAYQRGIRRLVEKVHQAGAKVVLLTPPPFDPQPLRAKGVLKSGKAGPHGYRGIYADYDQVLARYARWILRGDHGADLVVDLRTPLLEEVRQQRKKNPRFTLSPDGIHPNEQGHRIMAGAVLRAWGVATEMEPPPGLWPLVKQRTRMLHAAYLSAVGHKHPRIKPGLPLEEALARARELDEQIARLVAQARQVQTGSRRSYEGTIYQVHYPPTLRPGHLRLAVDYYVWIPDGVKRLRGVVVHQHGCGPGASLGGRTAADDLHWQALARRWDCALMGSSYEPRRGLNCRLWCDPRQGSARRFLQALEDLARESKHPELAQVPWCLWGHSGGAFWSSLMQTLYPRRIVAIWFRSGSAYLAWEKGQIPRPTITPEALAVPMMANPGAKEKDHRRFRGAWEGLFAMRQEYLKQGAAFFGWAPDPHSAHECGDSRYLAIPYFDFWLARRLPRQEGQPLQKVTAEHLQQWQRLMEPKRQQYVKDARVADDTPPPAPLWVKAKRTADGAVKITWLARADLESGLRQFVILRDGKPVARVPEKPRNRYGRPVFQGLSYHDTPEPPWPSMQYVDTDAPAGKMPRYGVQAVNTLGAVSPVREAR